jgi:LacI family transcriptional regulator
MKRTTIRDVALEAGVSMMTVSRVINNGANVQPETRARVQAVIDALNFMPSQSARSLRARRSHWILLMYHTSSEWKTNSAPGYLVDFQAGIVSRCQQEGYYLLMHLSDRDDPQPESDLIGATASHRPEGVLLFPPLCFSTSLLKELHKLKIPVVRVAAADLPDRSPCVDVDDRAAARQMTEHLIGLGHRNIGFIKGHPDHPASELRYQGFREALRAAGLGASAQNIAQGLFSMESGVIAARELLSRKPRPTAIFASNDDMAAGCLVVAHEAGISVPSQLSVAGFDDSYLAQMVWPPLTTIRQPIYDIGFMAAHQLFTLIRGGRPPNQLTLSHRLIERATTASPAKARS